MHPQVNFFQTGGKMLSLLFKQVFCILNEGTVLGVSPWRMQPAPCSLIPFPAELLGEGLLQDLASFNPEMEEREVSGARD